jgi:hypothetical protein
MAFDLGAYVKKNAAAPQEAGGFDLGAYVAKAKAEPAGSAAHAGLEAFGNTATLGYLPHLQALAEKAMPNASADVDAKLAAQGFNIHQPDSTYIQSRDANAARMAQQAKDFPTASKVGTGLGIAATALVPIGSASRAANMAGRLAQGAKTGALMGAVANPGDIEGEFSPLQLGDRAENAGKGAAIGTLAGGLVELAGPVAAKASEWLKTKAAKSATRSIGRPTPNQAIEMAKSGADVEIGKEMLEQGAVPWFGTPGRVAKRIEKLREKTWKGVEKLLDKGGDGAIVDGAEVGVRLLDDPAVEALRKTPGAESTVRAIEEAAETFAKNGKMSLRQAQSLKRGIDEQISYTRGAAELKGKQAGLYQSRTALRESMDDSVAGLGAQKGDLKAAFKKQSGMEKASEIADKEAGRIQANSKISLTDVIAGGSGFAAGDSGAERTIYSVLLAAANKGRRAVGPAMAARSMNLASKALAMTPSVAAVASKNPVAFSAFVNRLSSPAPKLEKGQEDPILNDKSILGLMKANPSLIDAIQDPKLREEFKKRIQRSPAQK